MPRTATARHPGRSTQRGLRRVSPTARPEHLSLRQWQQALRRQAAADGAFRLRTLDAEPFFGDFEVRNRERGTRYRISIRGLEPGENFCACPDFATNTLGTCKHLEFALHRLQRRRGAKSAFARGWTPPFSELFLAYGDRPELRLRLGGDAPADLLRRARVRRDAEGRIADHERIPALLRAAERTGHELRFYDDARAWLARERDARARLATLERAFPPRYRDARLRGLLPGAELLPYQREGAWFIATAGRCLLADDMGLGKTVQAIAGAELLRRHGGVRRVLVVCPASLKHQWAGELERFAERASLIVGGPREARREQWRRDEPEVKIVNYELLDRDLDAIRDWDPELLVLDEAQRIKNWATLAARAVRGIDAEHVTVLTGTPLENRIEELHALVEVVDRHLLGPLFAFRDRHAEYDPESGKVVGYHDLDRIGETLAPILLRRRKAEVLKQLPPRSVTTLRVPLTPEQAAFHDEDRHEVAKLVHKWKRYRFLSEKDQLRLRIHLQRMRMVCDSTYLLDENEPEAHNHKLAELRALLRDELAEPARKVVLFSTWLRMHELIGDLLEAEGWGYALLHGGVPAHRRGDLIARFHEDPDCRVFCSTDAGGTGLNLQCAEVVVNVDLPWNPAVLEQRIGRVHRLGQRRPVRVYHLVSEGIESGIEHLLGFKRSVFAGVLDGGASQVALGQNRLKQFVEDIQAVSGASGEGERDDNDARSTTHTASEEGQSAAPAAAGEGHRTATPRDATAASPSSAPRAPSLAATFRGGAAVLGELAKLAEAMEDPHYHRQDPETGRPVLALPLDGDGPLAGLQRALDDFRGDGR